MEYPKETAKPSGKENRPKKEKAESNKKKAPSTKGRKSTGKSRITASATIFNLGSDSSDDEEFTSTAKQSSGSKTGTPSVLPHKTLCK